MIWLLITAVCAYQALYGKGDTLRMFCAPATLFFAWLTLGVML
jgi:hypothetical protein